MRRAAPEDDIVVREGQADTSASEKGYADADDR
jgi:hypothetical protein